MDAGASRQCQECKVQAPIAPVTRCSVDVLPSTCSADYLNDSTDLCVNVQQVGGLLESPADAVPDVKGSRWTHQPLASQEQALLRITMLCDTTSVIGEITKDGRFLRRSIVDLLAGGWVG